MNDINNLPPLYKLDKNGKERIWSCWIDGNVVYREYGAVGGGMIRSERPFEGKSVKSKNKTTPEEQAVKEAYKEWISVVEKGYLPKFDDVKGMKMIENLKESKKQTGGHNINSVSSVILDKKPTNTNLSNITTQKSQKPKVQQKNITRNKSDTFIIDDIPHIIPMKAQEWELEDVNDPYSVKDKVYKYFSSPEGKGKSLKRVPTYFFIQPKLDGWRCVIHVLKDEISGEIQIAMASNSGKQYPWFKSLRNIIKEWVEIIGYDKFKELCINGFDGELYFHEIHDINEKIIDEDARFSTIQSICSITRTEPHELEDQIQFHCFDLIDSSSSISQYERFENLNKLFNKKYVDKVKDFNKRIICVETNKISTVNEVVDYHNKISEHAEGVILRSYNMKYLCGGKRSSEMRKFKYFDDDEFEIVGCKVDKGVSKEHFVWIVKLDNDKGGETFSAKPKGNAEQKIEWYDNRKDFIGKFLTVKFQGYSEDGIPRFPIGKAFREARGVD